MKKDVFLQAVIIGMIIGLFLFLGIIVDSEVNSCYPNLVRKEAVVTKIIDGDTLIIDGGEKVRLLGIDCDERGKECYSEAKEFLEQETLEETVRIETEGRDVYGRTLAYIFLEEKNINLKIVERGYCVARFDQPSNYENEIKKAEKQAIENEIGCKWIS